MKLTVDHPNYQKIFCKDAIVMATLAATLIKSNGTLEKAEACDQALSLLVLAETKLGHANKGSE